MRMLIWMVLLVGLVTSCLAAPEAGPLPSGAWNTIEGAGPLQLNGNASLGGGAIRLTASAYAQNSSVFRKNPVDVTSFETSFAFRISGPTDRADGITLCVQNDPRGASAMGSAGGYLGYGASKSWDTPGIVKSLAVEFDDYFNTGFNDLPTDHIGIDTDGVIVSSVAAASPFSLEGEVINVKVTYSEKILTVYLSRGEKNPAQPVLSYRVDILAMLGSDMGYIGFTGATASYFQTSDVIGWTFLNPVAAVDKSTVILD